MTNSRQRDKARLVALLVIPAALTLAATFLLDLEAVPTRDVLTFRAGVTAIAAAGSLFWWVAARYLGKATAWAALSLFLAATCALYFSLAPNCGGSGQRCTTRETLDVAIMGALMPILPLALFVIPAAALRAYGRLVPWMWNKTGLAVPAPVASFARRRAARTAKVDPSP